MRTLLMRLTPPGHQPVKIAATSLDRFGETTEPVRIWPSRATRRQSGWVTASAGSTARLTRR